MLFSNYPEYNSKFGFLLEALLGFRLVTKPYMLCDMFSQNEDLSYISGMSPKCYLALNLNMLLVKPVSKVLSISV